MKNTSLAGPGVFKYVLGSYPWFSQSVEDEEDEILSHSERIVRDLNFKISSEIRKEDYFEAYEGIRMKIRMYPQHI